MTTTLEADTRPQLRIEDVEYQRQGGRALLARLYRPAGAGPFPAVLQVHGGAWVNKDRTDNDFIARMIRATRRSLLPTAPRSMLASPL